MQPTTLTALAAVPPELRTNASSVVTAMRGVWQSFGIALLATVVQTNSVVHATTLGWQVRPDTTQGLFLDQLTTSLAQAGVGAATASMLALATIARDIGAQASVTAFADAYRISFAAAVVAFCLSVVLPGRPATPGDRSAMMGE
jgi:MFS transporter, DHA2 family, multidrug resistance protein